jgi:periplasmic protein TonB
MRDRIQLDSRAAKARLGLPVTLAALVHGSLAILAILGGGAGRGSMPPIYRVELIAAPAGERAIGAVNQTPPASATPTAPPKRAESRSKDVIAIKKAPPSRKAPEKATPTPDARSAKAEAPAVKAGGGPEGGKGADVASIKTEGAEFPDPAYLSNIVRQIALNFHPRNPGALHAEIVFLIRRDGSVPMVNFRQRSGSYAFDLEARGAIEAAANAKAFGPLPAAWADDALTVIFTFDPKLIR